MENREAGKLVIQNIAMLEEAVDLIDGELGEYVFGAIDQVIKDYVSGLAWIGKYDSLEKETYFGPLVWSSDTTAQSAWYARYWFDEDNPDENWWFSTLFSARTGRAGFRFAVDWKELPNANKRTWRAFAIQMNQDFPAIAEAGFLFEVDEGTWFLPWKLDATLTSEKYCIDAIEEALGPVKEALQKIENNAHSSFEKVVSAAREQFR